MATTPPDVFIGDTGRYYKWARNTFPDTATEDALTVKTIYDVREYDSILVRIRNTDGSFSLDFYVSGSVLQIPDDTSPSSDWFIVDDSNGNALTNIALALGVDDNRVVDVSNLSFLRVATENTSGGDNAEVGIDASANVKLI